mmetsp:Transcript_17522/g.16747  ORF Transcript_17522/g.16747 Transcript_17522/m.16747 type:complete len:176 (-) Transcript_17522:59-586(-)|eukprot:CAMPEP_0170556850 /NCGR_PEP_ID=MMETSP0211-20121228/19001_1 /TAXON_ID=311385 /ORGANISM="Pseudokeronopsis sp., Strain OXSARD2" /LENGTH=175 /DNA_ID=CAMNT_0010867427 /DNA_START=296 /DNA_END=823 /DNA_ORIENTATION=+
MGKYSPETSKAKKARLLKEAESGVKQSVEDKKKGKGFKTPKPINIKYGINHVTTLVELGKAKLVVMAHDVDPIEMLVFLPALCRKKNIPYCFVKGKARLGKLVHCKTATCLALTEVKKEDFQDLDNLSKSFRAAFNDNESLRRNWGGGIMGIKNQHMMTFRQRLAEIEQNKKANM